MASIDHSTHLPALAEPHAREEVGNQLQALLVELIDSWRELGGHGRRAGRGDRAALDGQGTVPDAHQR